MNCVLLFADVIVELPESSGHDAVMVVVDSVTKTAHFIPTFITVSAAGTARLFVQHVWKLHGLPQKVVSDRGPQFVAEFTRELYRMLGIKVAATTAYHPQGDGQTEHVNQELDLYLRLFVNQRQLEDASHLHHEERAIHSERRSRKDVNG
jgi:transposase InsO family protein